MRKLPHQYSHYVFGVIQSGLTSLIAAAIASRAFVAEGTFVRHALVSWLTAWIVMLPVVIFAAPVIRRLVARITD